MSTQVSKLQIPMVDRRQTIVQLKINLRHLFEVAKDMNALIKKLEAEAEAKYGTSKINP